MAEDCRDQNDRIILVPTSVWRWTGPTAQWTKHNSMLHSGCRVSPASCLTSCICSPGKAIRKLPELLCSRDPWQKPTLPVHSESTTLLRPWLKSHTHSRMSRPWLLPTRPRETHTKKTKKNWVAMLLKSPPHNLPHPSPTWWGSLPSAGCWPRWLRSHRDRPEPSQLSWCSGSRCERHLSLTCKCKKTYNEMQGDLWHYGSLVIL